MGVPRPPGLVLLGAALLVVGGLGFLYLHEQTLYVATDQATVTGALVQIGSPGPGQIRRVAVEVGDEVSQGQLLATVSLASGAGSTLATVRSPLDGIVVARQGNPGELAPVGRPIVILVDPSSLWVEALIDHGQVARLRPGQSVEVTIPSLGRSLPGSVSTVGPASAATAFQLLRGNQPSSGGNLPASRADLQAAATLVPVRIDMDYGDLPLLFGTTVSVRIYV